MSRDELIDDLARKLHEWYLIATAWVKRDLGGQSTEDFNPNAQKNYDELSDNQKYIDKYIAVRILEREDQLLQSFSKQQAIYQAIKDCDVNSDVIIHNPDGSVWCILTMKAKEMEHD